MGARKERGEGEKEDKRGQIQEKTGKEAGIEDGIESNTKEVENVEEKGDKEESDETCFKENCKENDEEVESSETEPGESEEGESKIGIARKERGEGEKEDKRGQIQEKTGKEAGIEDGIESNTKEVENVEEK